MVVGKEKGDSGRKDKIRPSSLFSLRSSFTEERAESLSSVLSTGDHNSIMVWEKKTRSVCYSGHVLALIGRSASEDTSIRKPVSGEKKKKRKKKKKKKKEEAYSPQRLLHQRKQLQAPELKQHVVSLKRLNLSNSLVGLPRRDCVKKKKKKKKKKL
ncbi:unnamed protein product [Pleuronectes platessa]|uniref:Uncharacterized protein n=1 Tax=Pleuronectes platessa TaxID=8262 RepID=A0A9N7VFI5_PLEPL|nr:unnamed protein product [Pleuronectes platessa]